MKPRAKQMTEKHTALTVVKYVLCCEARGRWGKQDKREMTGREFVTEGFLDTRTLHYFGPLYHPLNFSVLFSFRAVCMFVY